MSKDISLILSIVAAVREFDLETHLEAKRKILKLVFAFVHVNYARYNSYQHVFFNEEKRLNSPAYQDLKQYGDGASLTGSHFSGLHGDLMAELFNKETKGTAGPFRSGYGTDMQSVTTWVITLHIHCRLRIELKQKTRLLTSSTHKELTPRSIKRHAEHVNNLKETIRTYQVDLYIDMQI